MPDDGLRLRSPLEFLLGLQGEGQAHKERQPLPQALPAAGHEVSQQVQSCLHRRVQRRLTITQHSSTAVSVSRHITCPASDAIGTAECSAVVLLSHFGVPVTRTGIRIHTAPQRHIKRSEPSNAGAQ